MAYNPIIMIDPGHGKTSGNDFASFIRDRRDIGCVNGLEDSIVGEVAQYVRSSLEGSGYRVIMMDRSKHAILRAHHSNTQSADIYVSIHCNAFDGTATGTETFYWTSKSQSLANYVHSRVRAQTGLANRGVKQTNYWQFVGANPNAPSGHENSATITNTAAACLVELGFIDNPNDLNVVVSKKQNLGIAIANGIVDYIGSIPAWNI